MFEKIIFYILAFIITGLLIIPIIKFISKLGKTLWVFIEPKKLRKLILAGIILIVSAGILAFVLFSKKVQLKNPYVIDKYNYHSALGKVAEIREYNWKVKHSYDTILPAQWQSGLITKYDSSGNIIFEGVCPNRHCMQFSGTEKFSLTEKGFVKKKEFYGKNDKLKKVYKADFDISGNTKSGIEYDAVTGELLNRHHFERSKNGRKIKARIYDSHGKLIQECIYIYWKNGVMKRFAQKFISTEDSNTLLYEYEYDLMGLQKKYTCSDEKKIYSITTKRDDKGNIIANYNQDYWLEEKETWTTEYLEFDDQDNWTKCLWYKDGYPEKMTLREIIYY